MVDNRQVHVKDGCQLVQENAPTIEAAIPADCVSHSKKQIETNILIFQLSVQ